VMRFIAFVLGFCVGLSNSVFAANPTQPGSTFNEVCTQSITASGLVTTTVQLVAAVTGQRIYVCDIEVASAGAGSVQLEYGTGALCATGLTLLGTLWTTVAGTVKPAGDPFWRGQVTPVSNALCVVPTGTGPSSVTVFYDQY